MNRAGCGHGETPWLQSATTAVNGPEPPGTLVTYPLLPLYNFLTSLKCPPPLGMPVCSPFTNLVGFWPHSDGLLQTAVVARLGWSVALRPDTRIRPYRAPSRLPRP